MQTKTKKVVLGMVAGVFGLCAVSGVYFGAKLSKANTVEPTVITMEQGASMRLDADAPALRYFATLSDVKKGYDYGMIIVNAEELSSVTGNYHAELEAGSYVDVACVPYTEGGKTYIRGALTDVFTTDNFCESYFTQYVAIGYEKATDDTYIYATVDETYARSLVSTARRCELLDKEWTSEEQTALDYFVSVADSRLEDDFTNGLNEKKFTAKNADVEAWAQIEGVYDGTVNTQLYTNVYENITSVEFDMYVPTFVKWVGVTFGTNTSVYATPVTMAKNNVAANGTTLTTVNSVSYDISAGGVNFRYVMNSASEADVYVNDVKAYTISGYTDANGQKSFTNGRIGFASAGANVLLIDNLYVCYGDNEVLDQDFSGGISPVEQKGNVSLVHNGVKVEASQYTGNGYFLYDNASSVSPSYAENHLKTNAYSGITEMGFDVSVTGGTANGNGLYVLYGVTSCYYPMFKIRYGSVLVNSDWGTAVNTNGTTVSTYSYDFTKTTSVKIVPLTATTADLYLDNTKVLTFTVKENSTKVTDLQGSQNLWFAQADYATVVKLDNVYVTTAAGTVTENFDTLVSSSSSSVVFTNMSMTNLQSQAVNYYRQGIDIVYSYDNYKASNGLTVKEGFNVPDTAADTDAVMEVMATVQGDSVSYVLGESATDKGISLVVIENGKMFVRNVTDTTVVDGAAIDVDISTATVVAVRVTAGGTVYVSVGGGEILTLGTATYVGGNFAILETSGANTAYITDIAIKMQVYA